MSTNPPQPPSDNPPPPKRRPQRTDAPAAHHAGEGGGGPAPADPLLKRTVIKPAGIVPDPVDAAYVANRLTALTHELANLLDGSLRVINIARRANGDEPPEHLSRHLETVYAAMLQMADLVRNSMSGLAPSGADPLRRALGAAGSLAAAITHAVNVMRPIADDRRIELLAEVGPDLADAPAGPIYGVIINTVKNAIESIDRTGRGHGRIVVRAWMEAGRTGRCVGIEIIDDGEGPPPAPPLHGAGRGDSRGRTGRSIFDPGMTTKHGGAGIGLALCKEVVEQLGGTIDLFPRGGGAGDGATGSSSGGGGGAVLRVRYPAPAPMSDHPIG